MPKQHLVTILVVAIILVVVIGLIIVGYRFDWTGFNGNNKSGKALWDWLQLLFIPTVLTLGAVWITARQNHDLQFAKGQRQAECELAEDKYREDTLQNYIDKMSELFLHEDLLGSDPKKEVREIARVRTLTVLRRLDGVRKGNVLLFLHESGLVVNNKRIIDLSGAELVGANLKDATGILIEELEMETKSLKGATMPDESIHP